MNYGRLSTFALLAVSLTLCLTARAITNTAVASIGTNVVLSWPSFGYETYLIQYRHTLNSTDSWSNLTNAFYANSTNRTTFSIVPEPAIPGGVSTNGGGGGIMPPGNGGGLGTPGTGFYRVFHIPDWLVSFNGYQFDGPTFIPVDYASPDVPTNSIENSMVLINGQPTDNATFISQNISGVDYWGMGIFFDQLPNGTNTIQLLTTVRQSDTLNDQTAYMVFSNAPQTIVISNFVTYLDWSPLVLSNSYTFTAKSTTPDVDWEIDIYDVNGDFVNYQTGHSTDGNISWTWDLTDYTSASRKDDGDPFFYPYITIGDPISGWMPPVANQYPDEGAWLFAYMDKFYDDGTSNYADADSYYLSAISDLEGGPGIWGTVTYDAPIKYGRSYSQGDRDASWNSLRSDLQSWEARNFYYFGHGATNSVGGDMNSLDSSNNITGSVFATNTSKAYLSAQWVQGNVTANKLSGAMPFRFVFLDGCDTAAGSWPQAWGVPKQTVNSDWYRNSSNNPKGYRPNAFAGWDVTIGGNKGWGTIQKFWQFRQFWMGNWSVQSGQQNDGLRDVFDQALTGSSWVDSGHYSHLKIYGYQDMKFREFNNASDWP